MTPMLFIRRRVFQATQAAMADIACVSQGTVSKWERGELSPNSTELQRIRAAAQNRGHQWDDSWFFEVPNAEASP